MQRSNHKISNKIEISKYPPNTIIIITNSRYRTIQCRSHSSGDFLLRQQLYNLRPLLVLVWKKVIQNWKSGETIGNEGRKYNIEDKTQILQYFFKCASHTPNIMDSGFCQNFLVVFLKVEKENKKKKNIEHATWEDIPITTFISATFLNDIPTWFPHLNIH